MKLGSRPMTKNDWRLLLTLARCVRLATKEELAAVLRREVEQREGQTTASYFLAGFRVPTP